MANIISVEVGLEDGTRLATVSASGDEGFGPEIELELSDGTAMSMTENEALGLGHALIKVASVQEYALSISGYENG